MILKQFELINELKKHPKATKVIQVDWVDAHYTGDWTPLAELKGHGPYFNSSVGWFVDIVREDTFNGCLTLCANRTFNNAAVENVFGVVYIPTACIKQISIMEGGWKS